MFDQQTSLTRDLVMEATRDTRNKPLKVPDKADQDSCKETERSTGGKVHH
jgi:hypothetical protein